MRIRFEMSGGLAFMPGLQRGITLDTAQLSQADARKVGELVAAARFFDLPAHIGGPGPGAADTRVYMLMIEEKGVTHTVWAREPFDDPALHALIRHVRALAKSTSIPS